ncbi:futalosine hydrolase [Desulfocicer vacuolatum DSM 3385]|uniref:Futalosine hydrolase n=1 Tax=Desulfocicer vacuolatum DSM 3385 TaxID=1121400 RepID=A0A1W1ZFL8_9BACT|nr:futalosine hydrolase [Desulfocicer vacuolatum]SMC46818.1 futalosine hydrolase [Desulfocicer vacuolatum DSM 3385]
MEIDLLIAVATPMEIDPFLALSKVVHRRTMPGNIPLITACINDIKFQVIITGPGMVNTALALGCYLGHHHPPLIIQTGIAGFFHGKGLSMGGVGIATAEINIHCGVENPEQCFPLLPLPFSLTGTPMEGSDGQLAMHPGLVNTARMHITQQFLSGRVLPGINPLKASYPRKCPVISGPFITVSTITASKPTATRLSRAYTPVMESMEGMAAAHTACRYDVPFLEIRCASNPVGVRDKKAWDIPLAVEGIAMALAALFDSGEPFWTQITPPDPI